LPAAVEPTESSGEPQEAKLPGRSAEPMTTKNIVKPRGTYKRRDLTAESDE
jgi:hypothetical protein